MIVTGTDSNRRTSLQICHLFASISPGAPTQQRNMHQFGVPYSQDVLRGTKIYETVGLYTLSGGGASSSSSFSTFCGKVNNVRCDAEAVGL